MKKPEPINKNIVCSVCGLDWGRHGQKPTLETCVELLKADLAKARNPLWQAQSTPRFYGGTITSASGIPLNPGTQMGKAH